MRVLPAGDGMLLVELDDPPRTLGLLASLQAEPINGVGEIVPGARTLLVAFDRHRLPRETSRPPRHNAPWRWKRPRPAR